MAIGKPANIYVWYLNTLKANTVSTPKNRNSIVYLFHMQAAGNEASNVTPHAIQLWYFHAERDDILDFFLRVYIDILYTLVLY